MSDEIPVVLSRCWPAFVASAMGEAFYSVYAHRDGRRVRYVRGWTGRNENQEAVESFKGRRNTNGTAGSIEMYEAFPGEDVCCGCVASIETGQVKNGEYNLRWGKSTPSFRSGAGATSYCTTCAEREADDLLKKFKLHMRWLGFVVEKVERSNREAAPNGSML